VNFLGEVADWFTDPDNWQGVNGIPNRLLEHIQLSITAVLIGMVLGLPVGLVLGHMRRFGTAAMNVSNVGRAIPSFALLVIGAQIWGISEVLGMSKATLLALVALALPPIVTNSYLGMALVDDSIRDAARGMGMTGRQSAVRAELPVAVPMVLTGIRIATLQVVATAGLAALVASGGLGRYIIDGFAVRDLPQVFAGAVLVAALALTVEALLGLTQRVATPIGVRLARRTT